MQSTLTGGHKMPNLQDGPSPNWSTYSMPSRSLDIARTTESTTVGKLNGGAAASCNLPISNRRLIGKPGEGRPSKRLQKDWSNGVIPPRPAEPTPTAASRPDPFPAPATRRRQSSFRDHTSREQRPSHTSSALQPSPSKRYENLAPVLPRGACSAH